MKSSRKWAERYLFLALVVALSVPAWAQSAADAGAAPNAKTHLGYPEDWSSHHLVMPGATAGQAVAAGVREPRHVYNMVMRQVAIENGQRGAWRKKRPMRVDWAVSLENGFVPAGQYPAKFSFNVNTESCNGDYVLFGLTVKSGTQANIVGINNLYTEATPKCNNGTPWVSFAYNTVTQTGGQILTSPTPSADGTKVAFVESTSGASFFHVLVLPNPIPAPPLQAGTVLAPQTPTSCTTPTVAGCMTTVQIDSATNTNSSVWVDYNTDSAYVGADDGKMFKIAPVFGGGAPVLINDTNWPVTVSVSPNRVLTDPVVDDTANRIFIGDAYGYLYAVSLTAPAHTTAARAVIGWVGHGAGTGVVDPPIVVTDPANAATDQVFAFTGCSNVQGIGGAINQVPANFTGTSYTGYTAVDLGSASGIGDCTGGNVHFGTFDNQFWINGTTGGHMIACGFVSGTVNTPLVPSNPKMYMYGFTNKHVLSSTSTSAFVINNTVGDECSPLTEFFDGTNDRLFFGVGGTTDGFVESSILTTTLAAPTCKATPTTTCVKAPASLGGTSGIAVDNQVANGGTNIYFSTLSPGSVNGQTCKVTGGSATPYCAVKLTQIALQ